MKQIPAMKKVKLTWKELDDLLKILLPISDKVNLIAECYNEECDCEERGEECPEDIEDCRLFDDLNGELANVRDVINQLKENFK